jgi:hypothetical protein
MRGTTPPAALYGSMQTTHAGSSTAAAAAVSAGAVVGDVAGRRWLVAVATVSAVAVAAAPSRSACCSEKGVRLAHKMRVGPYIPVGIQTEKAEVGPTSGPTWRLSHLTGALLGGRVLARALVCALHTAGARGVRAGPSRTWRARRRAGLHVHAVRARAPTRLAREAVVRVVQTLSHVACEMCKKFEKCEK